MQLKMTSFLFPEFASAEVQKVDLENQFDPFLSLLVEVALKRQTVVSFFGDSTTDSHGVTSGVTSGSQ